MDRKVGAVSVRELTGAALLLLLLLAGLLSSWYMGRQHGELAKTLEDSAWLALSGQWENARKTADDARKTWEKGWNFRAVFGDHTPIEEIEDLFGELTIYGAAGERTEFARVCAALSSRMKAMGDAHQLSWWNVL